jgi:hypothetical protein
MMTFKEQTHPKVKELLELLNHSRRRVRIWYGDVETGKSWNDEYHVTGTIGRSTGIAKIPLMVANRRSHGGGAILDHCIIRIDDINARQTLYKHPNFHTGLHINGPEVVTYNAGAGHYAPMAVFNSAEKARRYYDFMEGDRYSK